MTKALLALAISCRKGLESGSDLTPLCAFDVGALCARLRPAVATQSAQIFPDPARSRWISLDPSRPERRREDPARQASIQSNPDLRIRSG